MHIYGVKVDGSPLWVGRDEHIKGILALPFHFFFFQVPAVGLKQEVASSATLWWVPQVAGCLLQLLCRPRKLGFLGPWQQLASQLAGRPKIGSSQPLIAAKKRSRFSFRILKLPRHGILTRFILSGVNLFWGAGLKPIQSSGGYPCNSYATAARGGTFHLAVRYFRKQGPALGMTTDSVSPTGYTAPSVR